MRQKCLSVRQALSYYDTATIVGTRNAFAKCEVRQVLCLPHGNLAHLVGWHLRSSMSGIPAGRNETSADHGYAAYIDARNHFRERAQCYVGRGTFSVP